MTAPENHNLQATACHEAGHAVAAVVLGVAIGRKRVSVVAGEGQGGLAHHREGLVGDPLSAWTTKMRRGAEKWPTISFAGEAALRRWNSRSCRNYHFASNYETAADVTRHFVASEEELFGVPNDLHAHATAFVKESKNLTAVQAVAHALMATPKMSGREITLIVRERSLIEGASQNRFSKTAPIPDPLSTG